MFEKITADNVVLFAMKHYDNPQCQSVDEFHDDMKRFKYIKRLLRKYDESGELRERLILNHMTVIINVFGPDAASTLLLFKIEPELWYILRPFMDFLSILPPNELVDIDECPQVREVLESI